MVEATQEAGHGHAPRAFAGAKAVDAVALLREAAEEDRSASVRQACLAAIAEIERGA